jgi:hypothetical protein
VRTRLLIAAGAAAAVLVVVAGVVLLTGDDGPTDADRAAVRAARSDPLDGVRSLAADEDRWARLVAGGGPAVADLLDAAQPELGQAADPASLVGPVVAPFVDGDAIDDEVVVALGRWTWPLLAAELSSEDAAARAGAVLARAEEGDREAVTAAVVLARLHRTLTGAADRTAVAEWRTDLARSASPDDADGEDLAGALRSGDLQDQPATVLRGVLAAWGRPGAETRPTDAARAAIASTEEAGLTRAGSAITIASYLVVIDRTEDDDAAAVVERLASGDDPLTEGDASLVALEDALLNVEDPALTAATETATLLRTA